MKEKQFEEIMISTEFKGTKGKGRDTHSVNHLLQLLYNGGLGDMYAAFCAEGYHGREIGGSFRELVGHHIGGYVQRIQSEAESCDESRTGDPL